MTIRLLKVVNDVRLWQEGRRYFICVGHAMVSEDIFYEDALDKFIQAIMHN